MKVGNKNPNFLGQPAV